MITPISISHAPTDGKYPNLEKYADVTEFGVEYIFFRFDWPPSQMAVSPIAFEIFEAYEKCTDSELSRDERGAMRNLFTDHAIGWLDNCPVVGIRADDKKTLDFLLRILRGARYIKYDIVRGDFLRISAPIDDDPKRSALSEYISRKSFISFDKKHGSFSNQSYLIYHWDVQSIEYFAKSQQYTL